MDTIKRKRTPDLSQLTLEEVVTRFVRTKSRAFGALDRSEAILVELIRRMKIGDRVTLGKKIFELVDNFASKNTAYRAKQFSRLELMDVTPRPKKVGAKK